MYQTAGIIAEIERKIEQLANQIEYLESEIVRDINEVNKIADQIPQLQEHSAIRGTYSRAAVVNLISQSSISRL